MNVGEIVWIDGNTAAIIVGNGHNADNIADGRVYVARLGTVEVIEPNDEGAYPYGAQPYDANASGNRDRGDVINPGGFGPDSPANPHDADGTTREVSRNTGQAFAGTTPPQDEPTAGAGDPTVNESTMTVPATSTADANPSGHEAAGSDNATSGDTATTAGSVGDVQR